MNTVVQKAAQLGFTATIFLRATGISLETAFILHLCRELDGEADQV